MGGDFFSCFLKAPHHLHPNVIIAYFAAATGLSDRQRKTPRTMKQTQQKNSIIEICPIRNVVARFGDKWSLLVLLLLHEQEVLRFNELCRLIPDVSSRVLSGTLRSLEADSLIDRKVYPVVPPKVEYRLTETGRSLIPLILQLTEWAQTHMPSIMRHRKLYAQREDRSN